jgi:hypothetical protein
LINALCGEGNMSELLTVDTVRETGFEERTRRWEEQYTIEEWKQQLNNIERFEVQRWVYGYDFIYHVYGIEAFVKLFIFVNYLKLEIEDDWPWEKRWKKLKQKDFPKSETPEEEKLGLPKHWIILKSPLISHPSLNPHCDCNDVPAPYKWWSVSQLKYKQTDKDIVEPTTRLPRRQKTMYIKGWGVEKVFVLDMYLKESPTNPLRPGNDMMNSSDDEVFSNPLMDIMNYKNNQHKEGACITSPFLSLFHFRFNEKKWEWWHIEHFVDMGFISNLKTSLKNILWQEFNITWDRGCNRDHHTSLSDKKTHYCKHNLSLAKNYDEENINPTEFDPIKLNALPGCCFGRGIGKISIKENFINQSYVQRKVLEIYNGKNINITKYDNEEIKPQTCSMNGTTVLNFWKPVRQNKIALKDTLYACDNFSGELCKELDKRRAD